jgi:hypothetical protein
MLSFVAFLQTAIPGLDAPLPWTTLGVGGGIAALVLVFYRQDRMRAEATIAKMAEASEKRLLELSQASEARIVEFAKDFRIIIQDNTRAMTSVVDAIGKGKN